MAAGRGHQQGMAPLQPHVAQSDAGERVKWHAGHAEACGCRAIPERIRQNVLKLLKSRGKL
jgi:hypothetical protein